MRPEFSQDTAEDFKKLNPHIFGTPGTPAEDPGPTKEEIKSERELQERIRAFLEQHDMVVIRSRMDKKTGVAVGTPDLLFALRGRPIAFECKLPGKKPTKEQWRMMDRMMANGWRCYVIDNFEQAVATVNKLFLEFVVDSASR